MSTALSWSSPEFYTREFSRELTEIQIDSLAEDLELDRPEEAFALRRHIHGIRSGLFSPGLKAEDTEALYWRMSDAAELLPACKIELALAAMILLLWQYNNPDQARIHRRTAVVVLVYYAIQSRSIKHSVLVTAFLAAVTAPSDRGGGESERLPHAGLVCIHLLSAGNYVEHYRALASVECDSTDSLSDRSAIEVIQRDVDQLTLMALRKELLRAVELSQEFVRLVR